MEYAPVRTFVLGAAFGKMGSLRTSDAAQRSNWRKLLNLSVRETYTKAAVRRGFSRCGAASPKQTFKLAAAFVGIDDCSAERLCENSGFFMISRCSFSGVANFMVQLDQSVPKSGNFRHL